MNRGIRGQGGLSDKRRVGGCASSSLSRPIPEYWGGRKALTAWLSSGTSSGSAITKPGDPVFVAVENQKQDAEGNEQVRDDDAGQQSQAQLQATVTHCAGTQVGAGALWGTCWLCNVPSPPLLLSGLLGESVWPLLT